MSDVDRPRRRALVLRRAWHGFMRHRGYDSAAALTFFSALTVLPATLLAVSAFSFVDDRDRAVRDILALLSTVVPDDTARSAGDFVGELLSVDTPLLGLLVGAALTIWTVSGYSTAFGRAINTVYDVQEGRAFWAFRGQMLLLAVPVILLGAAVAAALLLAPSASDSIFGGSNAGVGVAIWSVLRWPLMLGLLAVLVACLYLFAPNVVFTRRRWISFGTGIALVVWMVTTAGFAGYVTLVGGYGWIYGKAGIILVALLWFYLSNIALVIGAEVDAEIVRMQQLEAGLDSAKIIRLPVKSTDRLLQLARFDSQDAEDSAAYLAPRRNEP